MEKKHRQHLSKGQKDMAKMVSNIVNESRLWECTECGNNGELVAWSYDDLATRGGPVCLSCDADMVLIPDQE